MNLLHCFRDYLRDPIGESPTIETLKSSVEDFVFLFFVTFVNEFAALF